MVARTSAEGVGRGFVEAIAQAHPDCRAHLKARGLKLGNGRVHDLIAGVAGGRLFEPLGRARHAPTPSAEPLSV